MDSRENGIGSRARAMIEDLLGDRRPLVTVLRLTGVVGQGLAPRRGLTLMALDSFIERAFRPHRLKAVALSVNSPGGSPVQSALIARRIRRLADERHVPVIAFAEDVAASGGYWLALAADEIFADRNSIIGSLGVIYAGFGFTHLLAKLGVERRVYTSAPAKGMLDPFRPENEDDVRRLAEIQRSVHDDFVREVKGRRGRRLKGDENEIFSGAFWTGEKALEMGLIDGLGDLHGVMRARYGENVRLRAVNAGRPLFRIRFGRPGGNPDAAAADPAVWAESFVVALEERLVWARFGL